MAIRFRRTIRVAPGLKLNVGKKSASVRVGGKNFGHTVGTAGRTTSASIPGTGLGVTTKHRKSGGGGGIGSALVGLAAIGALVVLTVMFWPR